MTNSFSGYLYAKSLLPDDKLNEGYRVWFCHRELATCEEQIQALRESFSWRTDTSRRHPPVVVMEPVHGEERVLVVRFSDAGKDTFGRPQTLRQEALLVPPSLAAQFWNGTFSAVPDANNGVFNVESGVSASDFPGIGTVRLVNGEEADFSFERRKASVSSQPCNYDPKAQPQPSTKTPKKQQHSSTKTHSFLLPLFFTVFVVSLAINVYQQISSTARIENLTKSLNGKKGELKNLRDELRRLKVEQVAIAEFRSRSYSFNKCIEDLREVLKRLEEIKPEVKENKTQLSDKASVNTDESHGSDSGIIENLRGTVDNLFNRTQKKTQK